MRQAVHAAIALFSCATGVTAQETVRLIGEVRDVATDQPLSSIMVRVVELDRAELTDANGFFAFDSLAPGTWTFEASGFGYVTSTEASSIGPRNALVIRLAAAPVEIEGLYVSVVQRLQLRRRAAASRVFAWDKPELEAVIAPDVGAFLRTRGITEFVACGGEFAATDLPNCVRRRGRVRRLRIFIDDMEVSTAQGTSQLWAYDPTTLWALEFLPECVRPELRIYTAVFMEQVEAGRVTVGPLVCLL